LNILSNKASTLDLKPAATATKQLSKTNVDMAELGSNAIAERSGNACGVATVATT
jgi:hypothetical protein